MKYAPPLNSTDPNASYVNANPAAGLEGSIVGAAAIEPAMREIVAAITAAGLTPNAGDLTQLTQAIELLALRSQYELCEFYAFRHPTLKTGFQPAQGGLLENASTLYPDAWAYLQTTEGQKLCKTEAEWQGMTQAVWATLADGTQVGWDGIGGAPFYALHVDTGALRLPDLRGMHIEAAGFDALGVGGVDGDRMRNITAEYTVSNTTGAITNSSGTVSGAFTRGAASSSTAGSGGPGTAGTNLAFNIGLVVPTGTATVPRRWGALACVYLGRPR